MTPALPRGFARAHKDVREAWAALPHDRLEPCDYIFVRLMLERMEALHQADSPKLREQLRVEIEKTARELGLRGPHRPPAPRRRSPFSPSTHDQSDPYAALA